MAVDARRVLAVGLQPLPDRQAVGEDVVGRDRADVCRGRGHRRADDAPEHPVAALHGAGPPRRRRGRQHGTQAEQAPAVVLRQTVDPGEGVARGRADRDPVVLGERPVEERVVGKDDLVDGPVLPDDVLEEGDGLLVQRRPEPVGELGEPAGIDALEPVEAVEPQPLAEELRREPARLRVAQHPAGLALQLRGLPQPAPGGRRAELLVGHRRPEEEAEPAGELPVGQRHDPGPTGRRRLGPVQEGRGDQDAGQQRPGRGFVTQTASPQPGVEVAQALLFGRGQRPTPGPLGEPQRVLHVARLGGAEGRLHRVELVLQTPHERARPRRQAVDRLRGRARRSPCP